jgi:membrane-bound serine protease (ClpP class)
MPVIVYVYPNGARAASAGVYITEAADVAAMAPETNIGSATPIAIGPGGPTDVLGHKIENDAAAYVQALAAGHGRNPALAERMVRHAVNVTAAEAKRAGLVDVIAPDQQSLLHQIDGFRVKGPKAQVLHTSHLVVQDHDMPFQYDLLQVLVDPTIAFLLLTIGLIGIGFEILAPGHIVPGAFGAVCLLLGLYGSAQLPVTASGIALLVLAVVLLVAEAHLATHGALGVAGVIALAASGLLLFDTHSSALEVNKPVIIVFALTIGGFIVLVVSKVVTARRQPALTGHEELAGAECVVRERLEPVGMVFVHGALWRARLKDGGEPIEAGDRVRVESVDGLTLVVSPSAARPAQEPNMEGAELG